MSVRQRGSLAVGLIAVCALPLAAGQTTWSPPPPVITDSLAGWDSFEKYCAPCHGTSARGDGPVASALRKRPADLTLLARRAGGRFPADRVNGYITGTARSFPAHGASEMPVWGPIFLAFESDVRVRVRINNLVAYIESLQLLSTPATDGKELFRAHCATCHGVTGRGDGPLGDRLRRVPPDLTKFTARNGGVFPSERLYQIIDGRGVPSHVDREMPIWGEVFKAAAGPSTPAAVKARIDAIVRFLEAIQERGTD